MFSSRRTAAASIVATAIQGVTMLEVNAIRERIADFTERTESLRGYL